MTHNEPEYQVIVDPAANDRMYDHFAFVVKVSEEAANHLLDLLIADIRSLGSMLYRNPIYDRPYLPKGKYRYLITEQRYRIVYQVDGDSVYVDDMQDCRQGTDKSLVD